MNAEKQLMNAGVQIVAELAKELPRELKNRAQRNIFKESLKDDMVVIKEILDYENGAFVKHSQHEAIANSEELEGYMQEVLPEGETSGRLGFISVNVGPFFLGFVKLNPTTQNYPVDYFIHISAGHLYLMDVLSNGTFERKIKKHASFLLPSLTVKPIPTEMSVEKINAAINSGEGHFIELSDEDAERLGLTSETPIELDEVTNKRIQKKLIDGNMLEIEVEK